jgi:nicotinic acid mononucleotide adenylyltransferase
MENEDTVKIQGNETPVIKCLLCDTPRAGFDLFVDNKGDPVIKEKDKVVITFGRFSPPTKGHQSLFDNVSRLATENNADAFVFVLDCFGGTCAENPLNIDIRLNALKKMYPSTNLKFVKVLNKVGSNIEDILSDLIENKKYSPDNITIIEGSDRIKAFQEIVDRIILDKTANIKIAEKALEVLKETVKYYNGKTITVLQSGKNRKNVFNGTTESMSASHVKKAALYGNINAFTQGVKIGDLSDTNIKVLVNEIRKVSGKDPIQGGTRKRSKRGVTRKSWGRP